MDYKTLASKESLETAMSALADKHFKPVRVATGAEALDFIKTGTPKGATVMNGASKTLQQIGFIDYLKSGEHGWNNLHATIVAETDPQKQAQLRRDALAADFYFGSVHAVTETGELVIASNTGSQMPHLAFSSPNLILVVSTKKIVPTLQAAYERIEQHVIPLEDVRMKEVYGYGTMHNKTLVLHGENPAMGRSVHVVFVEEDLGF